MTLRTRWMTGVDNDHARALADDLGVGLMTQPGSYRTPTTAHYPVFSLDNGCFGDWLKKRPFRWERCSR
jgi:hypothetical protein